MKMLKPIQGKGTFHSVVCCVIRTGYRAKGRAPFLDVLSEIPRSPGIKSPGSSTLLPNCAAAEVAHCVFKSLHFTEVDTSWKDLLRALSVLWLNKLWLTRLWVLRGQKCHFCAVSVDTLQAHNSRALHRDLGAVRVSGGSGWMGKLLHRLPTNHISRSQDINNKRTPSCAQRHRGI